LEPEDYVEPWWGPVDPEVLIFVESASRNALLDSFVFGLRDDLEVLSNLPTLAVTEADVPTGESLPDTIFAAVTTSDEVSRWVQSWRGTSVSVSGGHEQLFVSGRGKRRMFDEASLSEAVRFASDLVTTLPPPDGGVGLEAVEHRQLEVVLNGTLEVVTEARLSPEDRALLQAAVDTLRAQLASPAPDRHIIGRVLNRVAYTAGGLLVGVSANYLTDLLQHFKVPWP
jgi:hypothetical protein